MSKIHLLFIVETILRIKDTYYFRKSSALRSNLRVRTTFQRSISIRFHALFWLTHWLIQIDFRTPTNKKRPQDYLLAGGNALRLQLQDVVWKIDERTLEVKIPLDSFTTIPSHYSRVREAVMDLTKIAVKYPEYSELAKKVLSDGQRSLCTGVFFSKDSSQKNRSYIHIFFREEIARLLVNPCYGYSRLQQITIDSCRSVYTARIYMQICRHADGKKWAIPYQELRFLLNIDLPSKKGAPISKHRYHEFRRRILDVARDELMEMAQNNATNYYFTYTEEFPSNRHSTPSYIIFNIYETAPSKNDITTFEKHLKQMRHFAQNILHIGQERCNRVYKNINLRNYTYVYQRHVVAWEYMLDHESMIQKRDSYYLKSIANAIEEEKISHEQGTIQMKLNF